MKQVDVWDAISGKWSEFRNEPIPLVADFLIDKFGKVLDLACGSGRHFSAMNPGVELHGLDISVKQILLAEEKAKGLGVVSPDLRVHDISESLPYDDGFIDSAIFINALHSIETTDGRKNSLKELFRVLKSGSEALITVWDKHVNDSSNREVFKNWDVDGVKFKRYYYLYTKEELLSLLESVGFIIEKVFSNTVSEDVGNFIRRSIVVIVKKP